MSFELTWLLNNRVLVAHVFGTLTDADNATFDDAVRAALNAHRGLPAHLVVDYSDVERIETEISMMSSANQITPLTRHPQLGLRIAITGPLLRFIPTFLASALTPPAQQYSTLDGALAYLHEADPTLNGVNSRLRLPA